MAVNPYVNKVVVNNQTLIDLTADTVDAAHLAQGYTAHDMSGAAITGTMSGGSFNIGNAVTSYGKAGATTNNPVFVGFTNLINLPSSTKTFSTTSIENMVYPAIFTNDNKTKLYRAVKYYGQQYLTIEEYDGFPSYSISLLNTYQCSLPSVYGLSEIKVEQLDSSHYLLVCINKAEASRALILTIGDSVSFSDWTDLQGTDYTESLISYQHSLTVFKLENNKYWVSTYTSNYSRNAEFILNIDSNYNITVTGYNKMTQGAGDAINAKLNDNTYVCCKPSGSTIYLYLYRYINGSFTSISTLTYSWSNNYRIQYAMGFQNRLVIGHFTGSSYYYSYAALFTFNDTYTIITQFNTTSTGNSVNYLNSFGGHGYALPDGRLCILSFYQASSYYYMYRTIFSLSNNNLLNVNNAMTGFEGMGYNYISPATTLYNLNGEYYMFFIGQGANGYTTMRSGYIDFGNYNIIPKTDNIIGVSKTALTNQQNVEIYAINQFDTRY